jgi:hypothetical protein
MFLCIFDSSRKNIYIFCLLICRGLDKIMNHLFYLSVTDLVHCTNEPNVSIPQLANLLIERSQNTNWTVVFKALITVHHMMCYGNEVSNKI